MIWRVRRGSASWVIGDGVVRRQNLKWMKSIVRPTVAGTIAGVRRDLGLVGSEFVLMNKESSNKAAESGRGNRPPLFFHATLCGLAN